MTLLDLIFKYAQSISIVNGQEILKLKFGELLQEKNGVIYRTDIAQVALPKQAIDPIKLLMQKPMSFRELVAGLYKLSGKVEFKTLQKILEQLHKSEILEYQTKKESDAADRLSHWLRAGFWQKNVLTGMNFSASVPLFFTLSIAMLIAEAISLISLIPLKISNQFLQINGSYLSGVILLIITIPLFKTLQTILKLPLLLAASGRLISLKIRIGVQGPVLAVNDDVFYATTTKIGGLIYATISVLSYFLFATACSRFLAPIYAEHLEVIALLLCLWDLNPYIPGEFTNLLFCFFHISELEALTPYTQRKALFSFLKRVSFESETRLLVFSIFTFTWMFLVLDYLITLLNLNLPNLFLSISQNVFSEKLAAVFLLFALVISVLSLSLGILTTLTRNLFSPLHGPFLTAMGVMGSTAENFDSKKLILALKDSSLFAKLGDASLDTLIRHGKAKTYKKNIPILVQGTSGNEVFVILSGEVIVQKRSENGTIKTIAELGPGAVFGEMALVKECKRSADVIAKKTTQVFCLTTEKQMLSGELQTILDQVELTQYFSEASMFSRLPQETLQVFFKQGNFKHLPSGQTIFAQGEAGDGFYMILRGEVEVLKNGSRVASLGQGNFFGETSLLASVPRTATLKTTKESTFVRLTNDDFWKVISDNPELGLFLESVSDSRQGPDKEDL